MNPDTKIDAHSQKKMAAEARSLPHLTQAFHSVVIRSKASSMALFSSSTNTTPSQPPRTSNFPASYLSKEAKDQTNESNHLMAEGLYTFPGKSGPERAFRVVPPRYLRLKKRDIGCPLALNLFLRGLAHLLQEFRVMGNNGLKVIVIATISIRGVKPILIGKSLIAEIVY